MHGTRHHQIFVGSYRGMLTCDVVFGFSFGILGM